MAQRDCVLVSAGNESCGGKALWKPVRVSPWVADPDLDTPRRSVSVQTCERDTVRPTYHLWKSQQCGKPGQGDLVSLGGIEPLLLSSACAV